MEMFQSSDVPPAPDRAAATTASQWRALRGVAAALVAGTFILFLFHRIRERFESRRNEQFYFPEVKVGCRLGAAQGGGKVAEIYFGPRGS
jgi:hypothetical protein